MPIEVKSPRRVLVDGIDAGDVVSVIANYGTRKKEILDALVAWNKADNDTTAALKAEIVALKAERQELRAMTRDGRREKLATELEAKRKAKADAEAAEAKAAAELAALG